MVEKKLIEHQEVWLDCSCSLPDHAIRITILDNADEDNPNLPVEFIINRHLERHLSIWRRIGTALRYILNRRCDYGEFGKFITTSPKKLSKLRKIINCVIQTNSKRGWACEIIGPEVEIEEPDF